MVWKTMAKDNTLWARYCAHAEIPTDTQHDEWAFAGGGELGDELAELVISGKKTATTSGFDFYELDGEEIPEVGSLSVVLNSSGAQVAVIRITSVEHVPFNQVTAEFARLEGEGDLSLRYWQDAHRDFFTEVFKEFNREFDELMLCVCETFEVVFVSSDL